MRHPLSIYVRSTSRSVERLTGKFSRRIKLYLPATQQSSISLSAQQTRPIIEKETLASAFSTLGLKLGDSVMVHSGISNLGKVAGGPKSVFDLIQDTIGPTGNVLYPVFPFGGLMYNYLRSNPSFDVIGSPSKMGAVTEYALKISANGHRSIHPTHSILAFGNDAADFVKDHHNCQMPFADLSPYSHLVNVSGKILLIGVGLNSTTSFHRTEDRLGGKFPVKVYADQEFLINCAGNDGREYQVRTLAHDPFISRVRDCNLVKNIFLEQGILQEVPVGNGIISILDARGMDQCLESLCQHGFTIYGKIWG